MNANERHDDERLFYISKSYMSDQMIAIFPAPNGMDESMITLIDLTTQFTKPKF